MKQDPQSKTPPKKKKLNIVLRLLAFLLTAALILGALVLVVYRDRFNLNALKGMKGVNLSVGTEVEISNNFVFNNLGENNSCYVIPTLAVKWTF